MPIGLDAFRDLSGVGHLGRVKIGDGEQIKSGRQSFFGRAIGVLTGSRQRENKAVFEAFKTALHAEFGGLGDEAISDFDVKNGKKLRAWDIRNVLDDAEALKSEYRRLNIPYSEKTRVGRYVDVNLSGEGMKALGSGAINTVYLGKYRQPDGSTLSGVFKEESEQSCGWVAKKTGIDENNPRFGLRNIATYRMDKLLGLGVIPKTEFGMHNRNLGIVMGLAPGTSPYKSDKEFELTKGFGKKVSDADVRGFKELLAKARDGDDPVYSDLDIPFLLENFAKRCELKSLRLDGDRLLAKGFVEVKLDYSDPVLLEKLNDLQWLDALCAQGDRHGQNYLVEQDADGHVVGVLGIDNDQSFGCKVHNPNGIQHTSAEESRGFRGCRLPEAISRKTAQAFMALTEQTLRAELKDMLTPAEIDACVARLAAIKGAVSDLHRANRIVAAGGWTKDNLQLKTFLEDPESSYVARDRPTGELYQMEYRNVVGKA